MKDNRLDYIDGLRGIGAFVIAFFWHYQHFDGPLISPFKGLFTVFYNYGYLFVELFFILSGYSMLLSYYKRIKEGLSFKDFLFRRFKRIYPLFLLTTLIVTLLQYFHINKTGTTFVYPNYDIYHFVLNVFLLQNGLIETKWSFNSPSWCISILMVYYVLFYLIVKYTKNKKQLTIISLLFVILGNLILLLKLNYPVLNSLMARGMIGFFMGILIYIFNEKANNKLLGYLSLIIFIVFYLILRFNVYTFSNYYILAGMIIMPSLLIFVLNINWMKQLLSFFPFKQLGIISTEIYLFHFPIQLFIRVIDLYLLLDIDYGSKVFYFIYILLVIIVSFIYHKFLNCRHPSKD